MPCQCPSSWGAFSAADQNSTWTSSRLVAASWNGGAGPQSTHGPTMVGCNSSEPNEISCLVNQKAFSHALGSWAVCSRQPPGSGTVGVFAFRPNLACQRENFQPPGISEVKLTLSITCNLVCSFPPSRCGSVQGGKYPNKYVRAQSSEKASPTPVAVLLASGGSSWQLTWSLFPHRHTGPFLGWKRPEAAARMGLFCPAGYAF